MRHESPATPSGRAGTGSISRASSSRRTSCSPSPRARERSGTTRTSADGARRTRFGFVRACWDGSHPKVKAGKEYAEGRFLLLADMLLHETIHQYHDEIDRPGREELPRPRPGVSRRVQPHRQGAGLAARADREGQGAREELAELCPLALEREARRLLPRGVRHRDRAGQGRGGGRGRRGREPGAARREAGGALRSSSSAAIEQFEQRFAITPGAEARSPSPGREGPRVRCKVTVRKAQCV